MDYPRDRLYHSEHLWLRRVDSDEALVGVTWYAQDLLGEIVYVDLPNAGAEVSQGNSLGTIESSKTASDLISPASGVVLAVNETLATTPGLINRDPYTEGWIARIRLAELAEMSRLMDAERYFQTVNELG
ncbi:MAG: glycine cleavage system protein GcvH [Burkholderiales bacterium]